jgi:hypothetical protein
MRESIRYRGGYKYQLSVTYSLCIDIFPTDDISTDFVSLTKTGILIIRNGYAWDGASGPTVDTKSSIRGSLVHDALYQLMRMQLLPQSCRGKADDILFCLCEEDGMWHWRAALWRKMVGRFAEPACRHENDNPLITAP